MTGEGTDEFNERLVMKSEPEDGDLLNSQDHWH